MREIEQDLVLCLAIAALKTKERNLKVQEMSKGKTRLGNLLCALADDKQKIGQRNFGSSMIFID